MVEKKPKNLVVDLSRIFYIDSFFFSSRRRHTRLQGDWSSDVCSSDLDGSSVKTPVICEPRTRRTIRMWTRGFSNVATHVLSGARLNSNSAMNSRTPLTRSEERRVGKECRSRWSPYH